MAKVFRNPDVLWRVEDEAFEKAGALLEQGADAAEIGTAVLFADGTMVSLNILGAEVWKLCDGREDGAIVETLLEQFDVERQTLSSDVAAFLAELADKGFIRYG
ncbi:MAG TPA: GeoRSP system PqqD family peptide chaperone [Geobacteraceae bacterium]